MNFFQYVFLPFICGMIFTYIFLIPKEVEKHAQLTIGVKKKAYWRFKGDRTWTTANILDLGNGLVEIYDCNYYSEKPHIVSIKEIQTRGFK